MVIGLEFVGLAILIMAIAIMTYWYMREYKFIKEESKGF